MPSESTTRRPRHYSGHDWDTSVAYSDSTGHYSDFTQSSSKTTADENPVRNDSTNVVDQPCIVTNTTENVKRMHLMPQDLNHYSLSRLEHALGLPWGSINVNSHLNTFYLSDELCEAFNQGLLLLLPESRIFRLIKENPDKPILELLNEPTYVYTLISTGKIRTICRHSIVEGNDIIEEYQHPFLKLPPITSPVHPVFVIWNIALRLNYDLSGKYLQVYRAKRHHVYRESLDRIFFCMLAWTKQIPQPTVFYAQPASSSARDNLDSLLSYRFDKAAFEHALAHAMNGETCFDSVTMHRFLGEEHRRRARKRRERFIRTWVSIVSKEQFRHGPMTESDSAREGGHKTTCN